MTIPGAIVALVLIGCYLGMTMATGIEGPKSKAIGWGCWLVACLVVLVCYSIAPT